MEELSLSKQTGKIFGIAAAAVIFLLLVMAAAYVGTRMAQTQDDAGPVENAISREELLKGVISGDDLPEDIRLALIAADILKADDKLLYFYAEDATAIVDYGSLLTDKYLITYQLDDQGQREILSVAIDDLNEFELAPADAQNPLSEIYLYARGEFAFFLRLSPKGGGDEALFYKIADLLAHTNQDYILPEGNAKGEALTPAILALLRQHGLLEEGELPRYFFSEVPQKYLSYGNYFSDDRVVGYAVDSTGKFIGRAADLDNVTSLEWLPPDGDGEAGSIEVGLIDGNSIYLSVGVDGGNADGSPASSFYRAFSVFLSCQARSESFCQIAR